MLIRKIIYFCYSRALFDLVYVVFCFFWEKFLVTAFVCERWRIVLPLLFSFPNRGVYFDPIVARARERQWEIRIELQERDRRESGFWWGFVVTVWWTIECHWGVANRAPVRTDWRASGNVPNAYFYFGSSETTHETRAPFNQQLIYAPLGRRVYKLPWVNTRRRVTT